MKINEKKIKKAILKLQKIQRECLDLDTVLVFRALDRCLKEIGWSLAKALEESSKIKK